jgi:hypothetical protein
MRSRSLKRRIACIEARAGATPRVKAILRTLDSMSDAEFDHELELIERYEWSKTIIDPNSLTDAELDQLIAECDRRGRAGGG